MLVGRGLKREVFSESTDCCSEALLLLLVFVRIDRIYIYWNDTFVTFLNLKFSVESFVYMEIVGYVGII